MATYKTINCVDDAAYIGAATSQATAITDEALKWTLVNAALMLWKRYAAGQISDIRQSLADRRMKLAETALAHAQETWVAEKALVDEMMDTAEYTAQYNTVPAVAANVEAAWEKTDASIDEEAARVGLQVTQCDDNRTARAMAIGKTDLMAHTMRVAEARERQLNDRRYSRQYAALALGRGTLTNALSMGQLGAGREIVRNSLINTINSGMSIWGYTQNRWQSSGGYRSFNQQVPVVVRDGVKTLTMAYPSQPQQIDINVQTPGATQE